VSGVSRSRRLVIEFDTRIGGRKYLDADGLGKVRTDSVYRGTRKF
jgi:hypothetical protein